MRGSVVLIVVGMLIAVFALACNDKPAPQSPIAEPVTNDGSGGYGIVRLYCLDPVDQRGVNAKAFVAGLSSGSTAAYINCEDGVSEDLVWRGETFDFVYEAKVTEDDSCPVSPCPPGYKVSSGKGTWEIPDPPSDPPQKRIDPNEVRTFTIFFERE